MSKLIGVAEMPLLDEQGHRAYAVACDALECKMLSVLRQIIKFIRVERKYWMAPIIIGLVVIGTVLALAETSGVAPFIYAIF